MRKDYYNDMRELIKTIKDFGWDRKGIQDPKDMKLIADYAKKIIMNRNNIQNITRRRTD